MPVRDMSPEDMESAAERLRLVAQINLAHAARLSELPVAALLLDRPHCLAGHAGKGADLSPQGEPLGGEVPMV
jgi:hypothetical protein